MKKKIVLSGLVCASLLTSPLFLTGCQPADSLFGGSPTYDTSSPYGRMGPDHQHHGAVSSSRAGNASTAGATKSRTHRAKSHAVPVEAPSVKSMNPRAVPSTVNSANSSTSSTMNGTSSSNTSMPTPSAPNVPAAAPTMNSPMVGQ